MKQIIVYSVYVPGGETAVSPWHGLLLFTTTQLKVRLAIKNLHFQYGHLISWLVGEPTKLKSYNEDDLSSTSFQSFPNFIVQQKFYKNFR